MIATVIESKCSPKYKTKSQTIIFQIDSSNCLPSNLQSIKDKMLSGSGFIIHEDCSKNIYTFQCLIKECWRFSIDR